jgi:small ligand-binding sensory domain FIST
VLRAGVGLSIERDSARAAAEAATAALRAGGCDLVFATTPQHVTRTAAEVCSTHDVVNCIARERDVSGVPGRDTADIHQRLGSVPVAGFFSGAEIAPGGGFSQLHQYTGVLAMLGPGT